MTGADEKSRRLADWHEQLENSVPEVELDAWHADLRSKVDQFKAQGLIDPEEAHDLRELADAAYSHRVEEAISRGLIQ